MRFGSRENPSSQPPLLAAPWLVAVSAQPDCCSGVKLKCTLHKRLFKPVSSYPALDRCRVLWSWLYVGGARCVASALRSSTEAASSVLSASPESWIARVGRANSSTRHFDGKQAFPFEGCTLVWVQGTCVSCPFVEAMCATALGRRVRTFCAFPNTRVVFTTQHGSLS